MGGRVILVCKFFVKKVLLEYVYICLFIYYLWVFLSCNLVELRSLCRDYMLYNVKDIYCFIDDFLGMGFMKR